MNITFETPSEHRNINRKSPPCLLIHSFLRRLLLKDAHNQRNDGANQIHVYRFSQVAKIAI